MKPNRKDEFTKFLSKLPLCFQVTSLVILAPAHANRHHMCMEYPLWFCDKVTLKTRMAEKKPYSLMLQPDCQGKIFEIRPI